MSVSHLVEKKLVFLSPSFNHTSLDFCLQEISSRRTHFLKSSFASLLTSISWTTSGRTISSLSQNSTCFKATALLTSTFPKTFLFQSLNKGFKAFNFATKMKLADPLKLRPFHQACSLSLKPSSFNHIFSNLKGIRPLLNPPPSSRIGQWLKMIRWSFFPSPAPT